MDRLRARLVGLRFMLATAWPIVLITAIGLVVAYQFVAPEPPRRITISTGSEAGAYHAYAQRYAAQLASKGITLDIRTSTGSYENIRRLENGEADVAFVQGGVVASTAGEDQDDPGPLRSLGSVAYEPVWVFYRGEPRVDKLYRLDGRRIAVGEDGSGIRGLALQLLAANDIRSDSPNLLPLAGLSAAEALQRNEIDAAFIVAAQEAPVVQVMLRSPGLRVVSFSQADAYLRLFPFLSKVVLPRGVVNLVRDLPPRDTVLLATTANVIVREDLHPALASLLLQAMTEVNGISRSQLRAVARSRALLQIGTTHPAALPAVLGGGARRTSVRHDRAACHAVAAVAQVRSVDLQLARPLADRPLLRRPQAPRERRASG